MDHPMNSDNNRIPLNALIVEDSEDDTLLLVEHLEAAGFQPTWARVDNEEAMRDALAANPWQIVFSDYTMPRFRGDLALEITRRHDPDFPPPFAAASLHLPSKTTSPAWNGSR